MVAKKILFVRMRLVAAAFLGVLLLMLILPSTGCVLTGPPLNPKFFEGMWHFGRLWFYPDALFYIGYFTFAIAAIVFGASRQSKFEVVGWVMLELVMVGMLLDS